MIKLVRSKIAVLALVASTIPSWATGLQAVQSRNCTWCHGGSAQGYGPAPRLAGQRPRYIENQLLSFRSHTRDNPFSKQYMWGAAANLSPGTTHNLAIYFSTLSPQVADDGDKDIIRPQSLQCRKSRANYPLTKLRLSPRTSVL